MLDNSTVNKLILLYALDKMEVALQEDVILDMVTENNWLSYMDCKLALTELIKNNMITNIATKGCNPKVCYHHRFKRGAQTLFCRNPIFS